MPPRSSLVEIARVFATIGATAFGGPAAHIAMMEAQLVRERAWVTHAEFLEMLAVTHLIPGPNSTELALHLGYRRGGYAGLVVAGLCFMAPATVIVMAIAAFYVAYGRVPAAMGLLWGVKPVVVAVLVQALWGFGRQALASPGAWALAVAVAGLNAAGVNELALLAAAAAAGLAAGKARQKLAALAVLPAGGAAAFLPAAGGATTGGLFLFFLKTGAVLFGSGYVLLSFIRADLVERLRWLTEAQLLDATAVGQLTPGPLSSTATFIGWILGGPMGALAATAGMFLPAFVFVAATAPFLARLRALPTAQAVLAGLNAGTLGLLAVVALDLGRAALVDPWTVGMAAVSLAALVGLRWNSAWLVLAGAGVGLVHGGG